MYSDVKKKIDYAIYTNNDGKVTAQNLNAVLHDIVDVTDDNKQNILVSGKNIKTINGQSIMGEGDISFPVDEELSLTSTNPVQNCAVKAYIDSIEEANKGYYSTLESLKKQHPNPKPGARAYVGSSYPYKVYLYENPVVGWVDTNSTGGDENIALGDYYTKIETDTRFAKKEDLGDYSTTEDIQNIFNGMFQVLSLAEYEKLENKENKLYFCYE
jgi:hypothetical protein